MSSSRDSENLALAYSVTEPTVGILLFFLSLVVLLLLLLLLLRPFFPLQPLRDPLVHVWRVRAHHAQILVPREAAWAVSPTLHHLDVGCVHTVTSHGVTFLRTCRTISFRRVLKCLQVLGEKQNNTDDTKAAERSCRTQEKVRNCCLPFSVFTCGLPSRLTSPARTR